MSSSWKDDPESPKLGSSDSAKYRSYLMKLSYLAQQTRPDMAFAVNTLAQYQINPRECHWKALTHILRYLRGSWDFGIYYQRTKDPLSIFTNNANILTDRAPVGFTDASYAEEADRKSRSAYVFMFCGAVVSWYSKKQSTVALSSTEAEYYALCEGVKEALWMRSLMSELSIEVSGPTTIQEDNMSTIAIANNPINHQRVKHIDVRAHFLREHIQKGNVTLVYCPTEVMLADALTKALPPTQHHKLIRLMGIRSESELDGSNPLPISLYSYKFEWNWNNV
jgi:hypothetical protein